MPKQSLKSYLRRKTTIFNLTSDPDADSDRYGDEPTSVFDGGTLAMAWVAPVKEGEEFLQDRDTWLQEYNVRYPLGTPVSATSEIEFEGLRHRVVSMPRTFYNKARPEHIHLRMIALENV